MMPDKESLVSDSDGSGSVGFLRGADTMGTHEAVVMLCDKLISARSDTTNHSALLPPPSICPAPLLLSSPLLTQTNTAQLWRHINTSNTSSLTRSRGITSTYTIIRHLTEHCLLILHDHNHNRISILLLMRFWTERNNVTLSFD